jgi:hypothetical protein
LLLQHAEDQMMFLLSLLIANNHNDNGNARLRCPETHETFSTNKRRFTMRPTLRIINTTSGFVFHADEDGKGNLIMSGHFYVPESEEFVLQAADGGYRIVNKKTSYFVHGDDDGKGNLHLINEIFDNCQIFVLEPVGDKFRLKNKFSGYYVHPDDDGTGNLRMYNELNDKCQLVAFYVLTTDPTEGAD